MAHGDPDYTYAYAFLQRLNDVSYKGVPLKHTFLYEGYNLWHTFQQLLFEDIKHYSTTRVHKAHPSPPLHAVRYAAAGLFMGLLSVGALVKLFVFRTPVLVYTTDRTTSLFRSDFRLSELYRFLHEQHIPYVECVHTVPGKEMYARAFKRRRLAVYLEFLDFLFFIGSFVRGGAKQEDVSADDLDLSAFSEEEQVFARHLIMEYNRRIERTRFKIRLLRAVLPRLGVKVLFLIDDVRYNQELILAARHAGVRTIALQHGHFTRYHVGWLFDASFEGRAIAPDTFLVWSEYWKEELLKLGTHFPPESIRVGGMKHAPSEENVKSTRFDHQVGSEVTVLIPYETSCPKHEVREYVNALIACEHIRVVFKLRPDKDADEQCAEYGLDYGNQKLMAVKDVSEVAGGVDVVVGVYSTYLYEMVAEGVPVGILKTSCDYGAGMVRNGLADLVEKEQACAALKRLAQLPRAARNKRRAQLVGKQRAVLYDSLSKIADDLELKTS